tara:strand:- start:2 stop:439 length:438 start_codon:yes stop_codon:yes gene_type:complete
MQPPFDTNLKEIADSMGIALYQRFTLNEASLFLRCPVDDIKRLVQKNSINYISVSKNQPEFFGYQLLECLLGQTTQNTFKTNMPESSPDRILRAKEVKEITGLSRTTLWRLENKGDFPRRVSLGVGSVGWRYSEVKDWLTNRQVV